jgi:hypothetical protein
MENVDFQRPTIQAAGGKGYVHTLSFVARAAPGSITRRLSDSQAPLSEFSYVGY